jgi:DNA primase
VGIVDEDIVKVREATDAAAVIGEQVALKRVGNRLMGLCPFHAEKSPSFGLNPVLGVYYCYGCQAKGDVITFVRETQHLDFAGAVEWLAARSGIQLRYDTPGATREHHRRGVLADAMAAAAEWYHQRLLTAPDAGAARAYLRAARGYDADTVRAFTLGWAPEGWDELSRSLGVPADVLADAGLSFRNRSGRPMDAFRGRVMFPIVEVDGRTVAFGGRVLPGGQGPKYKNSQEGPLYSKRRVLYGLNWAKEDVVRSGEVIVCEGYTDVIAFHRAGLPRAVATCGTALADEHMQKLKNFARRIILAYDADSAGQGAAERFFAWEQALDLDIHVLRLPPGTDPGEMGTKDPDGLREAVTGARPFMQFRLERIREAADLSTLEGRARAADRALEAIAAHTNDRVRDQYLMLVADWLPRAEPDQLRQRLEEIRRRPAPAEGRRDGRGGGRRPGGSGPGRGRRADGSDGSDGAAGAAGAAGRAAAPGGAAAGGPAAGRPAGGGGWESPDGAPLPPDDGRYAPAEDWQPADGPPGRGDGAVDPSRPRPARAPGRAPAPAASAVELEALRLAIHRPDEVAHLLEAILFDSPLSRATFEALLAAETLVEAIEGADPAVRDLLHRLAVEEPDPTAESDDVVAMLVRVAAQRAIADIEAGVRASQIAVDLGWAKARIEALADGDRRIEATGQLVAWLAGVGEEGA